MIVCTVCSSENVIQVDGYARLPRVTSDCKPFPPGGELSVCRSCGALFKRPSDKFIAEIGEIYRAYDVYYQGGGVEQLVLDGDTGSQMRRSELLCRELAKSQILPTDAKAIDIGCGNGGFVRGLSGKFPGWSLYGLELDSRHRDAMQDIPGFVDLIEGDAQSLQDEFDFISMIHVLEHFTAPVEALVGLSNNLTENGVIFIEIPNAAANPFDLLIADHVSHFTPSTLTFALQKSGFEIVSFNTNWVSKELSVVARKSRAAAITVEVPEASEAVEASHGKIKWLRDALDVATKVSEDTSKFGVLGTSIAATWLAGQLREKISFFVDEDTSRQGREFFGRPVYAPDEVPTDSAIFVAAAPVIAKKLAARLNHELGPRYVVPPEV